MRSLLMTIVMAGLAFGVWKWTRKVDARKRAAMFATQAGNDGNRSVEAQRPAAPEWPGYLGVVLAGETVEVASKNEGRLEAIFVKPGDHLRHGDPIAQLDVRTQREDLRIAQAALREARLRYSRRAGLTRGAISTEELSETHSSVLQSEARVRQLQQMVTEARVVAPFDGVVASKYLDAGALVAPGRPIVRLLGKGDPKVRFAIPEEKIADVTAGARVRVHLMTPSGDFDGVIDSVSPEVDAGSRLGLGTVKLSVPETWRGKLSTGIVAYVRPGEHKHG